MAEEIVVKRVYMTNVNFSSGRGRLKLIGVDCMKADVAQK
jgi:hypothetical protein